MATQTLTAKEPKLDGAGSSATHALPHPVVLGFVSGCLLWLSFPPFEWSWSAWFALVPLFLLVVSKRSVGSIYLGSWLGGFAFWLLAIHWIWATDDTAWLGWVVMALFLSLWWPGFVWLARFSSRRLRLPMMVAAPLLWVALEYIRAYVLTGFPWYYLAHSQYRFLYFTQIADFSGALGLSFLIAVVNAYWVDVLTLPLFRGKAGGSWWARLARPQRIRLVIVTLGVLGTLGYGAFRVSTARFRVGPRIALLQSNDINEYNSDQKRSSAETQAMLEALVRTALAASPAPDLIVWPETANPWGYVRIDPKLDMKTLEKLAKEYNPEAIAADWTFKRDRIRDYFDDLIAKTKGPDDGRLLDQRLLTGGLLQI